MSSSTTIAPGTYPLATDTWDESDYTAAETALRSGQTTMGPRVKAFEEAYAAWSGSKYAVFCNSGSSANLLAVGAQFYRKNNPLKAGDEVIVPAVSWSTTFAPLAQYGLTQVFVDVDPGTLNLSLDELEKAITPKTRAIFAVNLLGNPIDYTRLQQIIAGRDITLLEDNCESMGASLNGKKTGTFGLVGTQSTFYSHHMSTMEGGICLTDDEEQYHILLTLRAHGWLRNLPEKNHVCDKVGDFFIDSFRFALPGYCLRPTEIQGALGLSQLTKLDAFIDLRIKNAKQFQARFGNYPWLRFQTEVGTSSWFGFSMIIDADAPFTRADMVNLFKEHKIDSRPIVTGDFTQNPVISHMPHRIHGSLANARHLHTHGLFLGNNPVDLTTAFDVLENALEQLPQPMRKAA